MLGFIIVSAFICTFIFFFYILKPVLLKEKVIDRLQRFIAPEEESKVKSKRKDLRAGLELVAKSIGKTKFFERYKHSMQLRLNRANMPVKAEEFFTLCIFSFIASLLLCFLLRLSLFLYIVVSAVGWLLPWLLLKRKTKKRTKLFDDQLSDAISLVSSSLKSGYSFLQAIEAVTKEMKGPVSEEFSTLQKEINIGISAEKALENLVKRTGSNDLELMVTAVIIQRQVGGNLAEILDNISATIRDRVKIKGEIKTVTAQGRISGLVISLLPPALAIIISLINPSHLKPLFSTTIGWIIIAVSILMESMGIYFINRIIKIEV